MGKPWSGILAGRRRSACALFLLGGVVLSLSSCGEKKSSGSRSAYEDSAKRAPSLKTDSGVAPSRRAERVGSAARPSAPGARSPGSVAAQAAPATRDQRASAARPQDPADEANHNTEAYDRIVDNPFLPVTQAARSTFSIDVDTASYSNLRRFLNQDMLPPKDAVRIEELINYFPYDYASPLGVHPVAVHMESAGCPWNPQHRLVRIGLRGRSLDTTELPPRNFVFLIDVSGSMAGPNRLPLVQKSLAMLTETFASHDRVAIVVYAGQSGLVLPPTSGAEKHVILSAIHHLHAGGSTNGGEGIELAYRVAQQSFTASGVNRVILATDGDFNVGITNQGDLLRLIEEKRKSGVFLTVLGYGMDNIKDSTLEKLADHGNGHYAYIDTEAEARKVFVEEGGALVTIAKDVKLQIEFNPKQVAYYRLIGYENRLLRDQDFNDDAKDGGEMGSGHRVTALYEIVPTGVKLAYSGVDPLRYQESPRTTSAADSGELLTLSIRYKSPEALTSKLLSMTLTDDKRPWEAASGDFRFAAALAGFGMVLRESPFKGQATLHEMIELAKRARGTDSLGYRAECIEMMGTARRLMDRGAPRAIAGR